MLRPLLFRCLCSVLSPAESYLSADLATAFRKATGITGRLYDWQAECLTQEGVLNVSSEGEAWVCRQP